MKFEIRIGKEVIENVQEPVLLLLTDAVKLSGKKKLPNRPSGRSALWSLARNVSGAAL